MRAALRVVTRICAPFRIFCRKIAFLIRDTDAGNAGNPARFREYEKHLNVV
jgi:hypothetical protein